MVGCALRGASDLTEDELAIVDDTLRAALDDVMAMREAEGATLRSVLERGIERVSELADRIEVRVPDAVEERHERLKERLDKLLADAGGVPEEQLARVASFRWSIWRSMVAAEWGQEPSWWG